MKKALYTAVFAGSLLLVAGAALAAEPATDPIMAQPVAAMATGTDANSQTMMPTSASAPVPGMPNQAWNNSRPMMRGGNAAYGNPGMMGNPQGFNMVVQRPRGAMGIIGMVVGGVTLLMVWAIMVLTIIALCKWIKKQSK